MCNMYTLHHPGPRLIAPCDLCLNFLTSSVSGRSAPRREDDDSGPEDDRVTFTVSTVARDREARRDQFNAARDQGTSPPPVSPRLGAPEARDGPNVFCAGVDMQDGAVVFLAFVFFIASAFSISQFISVSL